MRRKWYVIVIVQLGQGKCVSIDAKMNWFEFRVLRQFAQIMNTSNQLAMDIQKRDPINGYSHKHDPRDGGW